jgi:hypothetical protein
LLVLLENETPIGYSSIHFARWLSVDLDANDSRPASRKPGSVITNTNASHSPDYPACTLGYEHCSDCSTFTSTASITAVMDSFECIAFTPSRASCYYECSARSTCLKYARYTTNTDLSLPNTRLQLHSTFRPLV